MKVQTSELKDLPLDWAVAVCKGATEGWRSDGPFLWRGLPCVREGGHDNAYTPSRYWAHGGELIEDVGIDLRQIKQQLFSIYAYRHIDRYPDAEVIMFATAQGPDRLLRAKHPPHPLHGKWMAKMAQGTDSMVQWSKTDFLSDTPLIAAMRCYVAFKLGPEVDIPDELVTPSQK